MTNHLCLLVEDDEVTAFLSMRVLNDLGRFDRVDRAVDDYEALEKCRTSEYDLIILDLALPGMDGCAFLEAYTSKLNQSNLQQARIVVVSSSDDTDEVEVVKKHDAVLGVLLKPLKPEALNRLLNECFLTN